jgi:LacI family transcriptional regulator
LHAAHVLGRSVPADLAVVGVDDIAEGSHFWPSLTTIHQPVRDAGAIAVRTIGELIGDDNGRPGTSAPPRVRSILLEPTLIVRESSRPGPVDS